MSRLALPLHRSQAERRNRIAAEERASAHKHQVITAAEADARSKALQGQGIADQRAAIVNGLKESIGGGQALSSEKVSELLLITQYFDTLEKLAGEITLKPHFLIKCQITEP